MGFGDYFVLALAALWLGQVGLVSVWYMRTPRRSTGGTSWTRPG